VHGRSALAQLLYLNAKTYLPDDLHVKMDRASMAHALETRSPFLDRAVMEFAAALPDRFKLRGRTTKWLLRAAFRDVLPREILTRGKMGFGVPLATWFRAELREALRSLLLEPGARLGRYVDRAHVGRLVDAHLSGRANVEHQLWLLLTFEVWLRSLARARA
jgi:asparagine synthase (glutamine-hydrolysing)